MDNNYNYFDFSHANSDLVNFYGSACFKIDNDQCFFAIDNDGVLNWIECSKKFYEAAYQEYQRLKQGKEVQEEPETITWVFDGDIAQSVAEKFNLTLSQEDLLHYERRAIDWLGDKITDALYEEIELYLKEDLGLSLRYFK